MTFEHYPSSGTVSYVPSIGRGAGGVVTVPGTLSEISVPKCRLEFNNSRYVIDDKGFRVDYAVDVFCPVLSGAGSIPEGANFTTAGKTFTVVQVPPLQTHTVLRCK